MRRCATLAIPQIVLVHCEEGVLTHQSHLAEEDLDDTIYQGVFEVLIHGLPGSLSAIVQPPGQRRNPSERCLYYGR